jgi:hypothetical protein
MTSDISFGYVRGKLPKEDREAQAVVEAASSASVNVNAVPNTEGQPLSETLTQGEMARLSGYTGNQCTNCNSMRMQVAGHCEVCSDCGTTTGCS